VRLKITGAYIIFLTFRAAYIQGRLTIE